jgi:uncharacterized RDD family membrane protein YckC
MRCPKCHYLSFDPEPRCKNCGYDLEVADADLALHASDLAQAHDNADDFPELTLRESKPSAAPITLELAPYPSAAASAPAFASAPPAPVGRLTLVQDDPLNAARDVELHAEDVEDVEDVEIEEETPVSEIAVKPVEPAPPAAPPAPRAPFRAPHTTTDLPLFVKRIPEPEDLAPSDPPRPPLGVRRAAPEPVRTRAQAPDRRLGPLDRDLLDDLKRVEREEAAARASAADELDESQLPVPASQRAAAVAVDMLVLGGIAAFVFWATLRVCGVSLSDLGTAALVPMVAFLILMDVGYLLMFTAAGGQTVGKMLMHIRVVGESDEDGGHLSLEQAAWRAALSVIGLGLGWLPALFGSGLALHDRLAHTRVVRA